MARVLDRFMELAPVAGLAYFVGVGALKLLHDAAGWPPSFEWAAGLAVVPAVFAVLTRAQRGRKAE
mgnify:CR=1 FL=1